MTIFHYVNMVCLVQAWLQWTFQRIFFLGIKRTFQPVLRTVRVLGQWHLHCPDQPHVRICRQPPRMVSFLSTNGRCLVCSRATDFILLFFLPWLLCAHSKIEAICSVCVQICISNPGLEESIEAQQKWLEGSVCTHGWINGWCNWQTGQSSARRKDFHTF